MSITVNVHIQSEAYILHRVNYGRWIYNEQVVSSFLFGRNSLVGRFIRYLPIINSEQYEPSEAEKDLNFG